MFIVRGAEAVGPRSRKGEAFFSNHVVPNSFIRVCHVSLQCSSASVASLDDLGTAVKMRLLDNAGFGAVVLLGTEEGRRTCANGLPIIPSSIRMLGRFEKIKSIEHPSLCTYIELIRCTLVPNAVILISEHYDRSISTLISTKSLSEKAILHVTSQVVHGISAVHDAGFCLGILNSDSILITDYEDDLPNVRITQYGVRMAGIYKVGFKMDFQWHQNNF
ncbi:hypothetical protein KIN20_016131 [Parelaphostrongylus tenuis]|uniref:Protein kinase domain-containing protein n=1 Tax=Parelaphostrongylus tenuis TaxID=148309 RepID=A0AAD5N1L9_PARTN|nr:hypothetical protein KIN20_016131 [Parelaphostrongylus tenuis]